MLLFDTWFYRGQMKAGSGLFMEQVFHFEILKSST
jgi:hypothetical protein